MNEEKDKKFTKNIHMEIHALRRIQGYKPSLAERNISKFVIEHFKDKCEECKEADERLKNQPQQKQGFMSRINNIAKDLG